MAMIRPLCDTAETVAEVDEAVTHLCASLIHADGEMRVMIREDIDKLIDRRLELMQR